MTTPDDSPQLAGSLLLADPALRGDPFRRSVVLLTSHDPGEGAAGYILNRPLEKKAGDLLRAPEFQPLAEVPVFLGGPVGRDQLTFVSFRWLPGAAGLRWTARLSCQDAIRCLENGEVVRAFTGYSGWSPGQLENEIRHRSWVVAKPVEGILKPSGQADLWREILTGMGPWYTLLSLMPENPGLN